MAETKIEWADFTWNPWRGCQHATLADGSAHPGCTHCYAETMAKRNPGTLGQWGEGGTRVVAAESYWKLPAKWDKAAAAEGVRKRVFCASLADVFEGWQGPMHATGNLDEVMVKPYLDSESGPENWMRAFCDDMKRDPQGWRLVTMADVRRRVFETIDACPHLDFLLLTKRPQNVRAMWPLKADMAPIFPGCPGKLGEPAPCVIQNAPRKNVWLLTSVSDQATADVLVPELLKCRDLASVLGLSAEPLLGPIDLRRIYVGEVSQLNVCAHEKIDWVIVGGESGHHARPMDPQWARDLRDQCQAAGVAYFFKQWGEWTPDIRPGQAVYTDGAFRSWARVGKAEAGRELDGRTWDQFPEVGR